MIKQNIKILIIALAILGTGLFLLVPVYAQANDLIDVFFQGEPDHPLFEEANFLPGEEVVHWVEVTNKSDQTLPIGVEMTRLVCPGSEYYCLADKLNLIIKDKDFNELYENSLTGFYNEGEKKIADLTADTTEKYYFSITFLPGSDDDYQGLEVGFDFKVGALGTESIGGEGSAGGTGGGGTGGGYFIPGLEIFKENASEIEQNQVTITWDTTYDSTSRVIYSSENEPHSLELDNLPDYGYAHSTTEDTKKVPNPHSVIITGLTPGITYYYRCISHGSFALSKEHSFTTLTEQEAGQNEFVAGPEGESIEPELEVKGASIVKGLTEITERGENQEQTNDYSPEWEEEKEPCCDNLLAAVGFQSVCWILILLIVVLIMLFFLSIRKARIEKNKLYWLLPLLVIVLFVVYYFYCPYFWLVLIITIVVSLILYIIIMLKA